MRKINEVWSVDKCAYIRCFIADGLGPLATELRLLNNLFLYVEKQCNVTLVSLKLSCNEENRSENWKKEAAVDHRVISLETVAKSNRAFDGQVIKYKNDQ